jgi:hypothetical protein
LLEQHCKNLDFPAEINKLYLGHLQKHTRPTVGELSKLLVSMIGNFSKSFIIVDALDECNYLDETRSNLVEEVSKLSDAYVLWTSRHLSDIESLLEDHPRLEIRANDDDVDSYLKGCVERSARLRRHVSADANLMTDISEAIIRKADGM